ncbi:MAG: hypothetical protein LBC83_07475 [Oscillospiraceae bacterium]|jgi:hypothetical protein|nr:hypothetical protein [Oscillospiraceae bacterium]
MKRMKQGQVVFLAILILAAHMLVVGAQPTFRPDGDVNGAEWYGTPVVECIRYGDAYNAITYASVRYMVFPESASVGIACLGQAPGANAESALGIVCFVDGREIAALRQTSGASYDAERYFCEGGIMIAQREDESYNPDGDFCLEIRIGCKDATVFAALERLVIRILDANGEPSKDFALPVRAPAPETTAPATTTETTTKATTSKATTTVKPTTTARTTTSAKTTKQTTTAPILSLATITTTTAMHPAPQETLSLTAWHTSTVTSLTASGTKHNAAPVAAVPNKAPSSASTALAAIESAENIAVGALPPSQWQHSVAGQPEIAAVQVGANAEAARGGNTRRIVLLCAAAILLLLAAGFLALWIRANCGKKERGAG